jgi:predicted enzyme involved in methoxymalonyl-ACP biosynthesis
MVKRGSVWKVQVTDKISGNSVISIFYIDRKTRELLKQEIDAGNRKMLLEIME